MSRPPPRSTRPGRTGTRRVRRRCSPPALPLLQRELAVVREPRDADPDQPQRAGPVAQAAIEQGAGEVADPLRIVDADVEARRAAPDREVAVAELRRHRPRGEPVPAEVRAE